MRSRRGRLVFVAGSLLAALVAFVAVGTAAPPEGTPGAARAAVVAYWTPDRVARAIPREVSPRAVPGGGAVSPAPQAGKPGGGGGGTTTTTVTGASWTGGGSVKKTTGKVLFTMGGVDYVCSGSVVADTSTASSLVLTAGHCVYDETGRAFATNWMFVPNYENGGSITTSPDGSHSFSCDRPGDPQWYGCWTASALVTTTAWANGGGSLSGFNNDYAFAVLGAGGQTGQSLQLDTIVGANAIAFNQPHPAQVYSFGYPAASPYDGKKLIYCAGKDVADTWGRTTDFGLDCNMTGGSSGGPWFIGFNASNGTGTLTSVNSFKYTSGRMTKYMFGPYLGSYAKKTYDTARLGVSGSTLVAP